MEDFKPGRGKEISFLCAGQKKTLFNQKDITSFFVTQIILHFVLRL